MAAPVDPHNVENFLPVVVVILKNITESLVETEEAMAAYADAAPPQSRIT